MLDAASNTETQQMNIEADIRNLGKWLNEEQTAPIDRQALAKLLAWAQMADKPAAWVYPEFFEGIAKAGCWTAYAGDGSAAADEVKRIPLYRGALTGGDQQRHIICLCPDCTKPARQQEPDRVKFERHWRKTRGEKKANRELPRHPLQPQTYIQDSANRHWVTWQAAVKSASQPASKPLTFPEEAAAFKAWFDAWYVGDGEQGETIPGQSDPHFLTYIDQYTLGFGAWMAAKHAAAKAGT